jgi:hypothetical protein
MQESIQCIIENQAFSSSYDWVGSFLIPIPVTKLSLSIFLCVARGERGEPNFTTAGKLVLYSPLTIVNTYENMA